MSSALVQVEMPPYFSPEEWAAALRGARITDKDRAYLGDRVAPLLAGLVAKVPRATSGCPDVPMLYLRQVSPFAIVD